MYTTIINAYEDRKRKLSSVLANRKDLNPENQHQIYGAINEIDLFVKTLREYQKKYEHSQRDENSSNPDDPRLLSVLPSPNERFVEAPKPSFLSKIFRK